MHWFYRTLEQAIKAGISFLIIGLRPLLGPATCRYEVGCTKYAVATLKTLPLPWALWLIVKRVLSCNPL